MLKSMQYNKQLDIFIIYTIYTVAANIMSQSPILANLPLGLLIPILLPRVIWTLAPMYLLNTIIVYAYIKRVKKIYENTARLFTWVVMIGYSILSISYLY